MRSFTILKNSYNTDTCTLYEEHSDPTIETMRQSLETNLTPSERNISLQSVIKH